VTSPSCTSGTPRCVPRHARWACPTGVAIPCRLCAGRTKTSCTSATPRCVPRHARWAMPDRRVVVPGDEVGLRGVKPAQREHRVGLREVGIRQLADRDHARSVSDLALPAQGHSEHSRMRVASPCRGRFPNYGTRARCITTSSAGHGGPARRAPRSSCPARFPFGSWSSRSQRHAATIARTSRRHARSSS
jgi:hypothetical protein